MDELFTTTLCGEGTILYKDIDIDIKKSYSFNVKYNYRYMQVKTHRKKRINKKWLKRYGITYAPFVGPFKEFFPELNKEYKFVLE